MAKDPEVAQLRSRLTELKHEADGLVERQVVIYQQATEGSSDQQVEEAARQLIGNRGTAVLQQDPEAELKSISSALNVNREAQKILAQSIGLWELREGYQRAMPAFERAVAHIPRLAAALEALEAEQAAAMKDLRAFEAIDGQVAGLSAQHPKEKAPYSEWQLAPLRTWHFELVGDGANRSKLDLWREDCADLGLNLKP